MDKDFLEGRISLSICFVRVNPSRCTRVGAHIVNDVTFFIFQFQKSENNGTAL